MLIQNKVAVTTWPLATFGNATSTLPSGLLPKRSQSIRIVKSSFATVIGAKKRGYTCNCDCETQTFALALVGKFAHEADCLAYTQQVLGNSAACCFWIFYAEEILCSHFESHYLNVMLNYRHNR